MSKTIGIVGEPIEGSKAQLFLVQSLNDLQDRHNFTFEWVRTAQVEEQGTDLLSRYDGLWSAPGGQFKSTEGALSAIRYARENNIPHLATCGGFQHTILEIARDVLGIPDAMHEEYDPNAQNLVITKMACSLRGTLGEVVIAPDTLAYRCYQRVSVEENFLCSFGVSPSFQEMLKHKDLKISGRDKGGEIRILEVPQNRFFIATLYVPQMNSSKESPHPLIEAFVQTSCE